VVPALLRMRLEHRCHCGALERFGQDQTRLGTRLGRVTGDTRVIRAAGAAG
jgi:hypothetical protein